MSTTTRGPVTRAGGQDPGADGAVGLGGCTIRCMGTRGGRSAIRAVTFATAAILAAAAEVPFVGCPSEGQAGHIDPPTARRISLAISPHSARQLAWYEARASVGVLAPRDWQCTGSYGSSGTRLVVRPRLTGRGTGVVLGLTLGYTSGRFAVAEMIRRLFPHWIGFADRVERDYDLPPSPAGPYPADRLLYRDHSLAEYVTPPGAEGLASIPPNDKVLGPVHGFVMLTGPVPNMVHLSIQLPPEQAELSPVIMQETARWARRNPEAVSGRAVTH